MNELNNLFEQIDNVLLNICLITFYYLIKIEDNYY